MMKNYALQKLTGGFCTCLLGILVAGQAQAQTPGQAQFAGTSVWGNASGSGAMMTVVLDPTGPTPYLHMFGNNFNSNGNTDNAGSINYIAGYNQNPNAAAHSFQLRDAANGNWVRAMQIYQNGQVLIGAGRKPINHTDYKLAVEGKLVSQSLYVTAPSNWADFVFAPTYKLMSLPMLEAYLRLNKHLPAIPAANEVEAVGYSVTEMDAKLLQSVEELTLHVIELSKQNTRLQAELQQLRKQVSAQSNGRAAAKKVKLR